MLKYLNRVIKFIKKYTLISMSYTVANNPVIFLNLE